MSAKYVRRGSVSVLISLLTTIGVAACGGGDGGGSDGGLGAPKPVACAELSDMSIAAERIGLPTSGAVVTSTEIVAGQGDGPAAIGEYCKVLGEIKPVDPEAPPIQFQVNLPVEWNHKVMMFGGGGYNGIIATGEGNVHAGAVDKPVPLGRGYATFGSDSGHQAGPATSRDGAFGLNDEALRNFAGEALKKTRDAAWAVITAHYGETPSKTYFAGGSTGGREALLAVGNWPQDFDGPLSCSPPGTRCRWISSSATSLEPWLNRGPIPTRRSASCCLSSRLRRATASTGLKTVSSAT